MVAVVNHFRGTNGSQFSVSIIEHVLLLCQKVSTIGHRHLDAFEQMFLRIRIQDFGKTLYLWKK